VIRNRFTGEIGVKTRIIAASAAVLALYLTGAVGCLGHGEKEPERDSGGPAGEPSEETAGPAAPAGTFDEALESFVRALKSNDPRDFEPLVGDTVLAGEPFTEGEFISRDDFVALLSAGSSPYAGALYADERVSSFVNEFEAGTLDKAEWGSGGYSVATADYAWFVAFEPDADGNWYLKVCAVALVR
jgi:hypothetical protein